MIESLNIFIWLIYLTKNVSSMHSTKGFIKKIFFQKLLLVSIAQ